MALQERGVRLVVENQSAFNAALAASNAAVNTLGTTSAGTARDIDTLTNRITFQQRTLGVLQQELAQTAAKYGEGSTQAQRKQIAVDKLTTSIAKDEAALAQLQAQENAAAASSNQLAGGLDKAGKSGNKFGEVMTGALRAVGQFAVQAMAQAARAVASFVANSIKGAGDFEQGMNVLQAQSGATAAQMDKISAKAKELGADLTLPATSAIDAGTAMLELSKGGLDVDQSMDAAKGTLQLAAAAETDVATAANIATGALSAFGLEGNKAGYIADLLTNAANKSRASIGDVAQGFQQAAFRFKSAGQGADDLSASLTVLIQAGLGGSDAGTALQNAVARLQGPTDKAAKLMAELGINVYDANGNMLPMEKIIGVLQKGLGGMTQQERNAALQTIFLSDGMKAMIPLLDAGADGFAKTKAEMNEQGAAAKIAGAQMKGLNGAAAGLMSQLETLALNGVQPLLPLLTALLTRGAELAGQWTSSVGPAMQTTIEFLLAAADVIETGAVPALYALSAATVIYALTNLPSMIAALGTATAAIIANGAAMLAAAGPFAVIAGAIAMVMIKYKQLDDQLKSVADRVLAGNKAYQESVSALEAYDQASETIQEGARGQAEALRQLQDEQRGALEQYTLHRAAYEQFDVASGQTAASLQAERDAINQRTTAIQQGTAALNGQIETYQHVHDTDAIEDVRLMRDAHDDLGGAVQDNVIDYEKLNGEIEKVTEDGAKAIRSYVDTAIELSAKLVESIQKGNKEQTADAAKNYSEQTAAAKAAIGEQLIAFTVAQAEMKGTNQETTNAIISQIEKEFGIAGDMSRTTFTQMENDISTAMENGGGAIDGLGGQLRGRTDDAIKMKEKMDALATEYRAELVHNFEEGLITIDELKEGLAKIPADVYSEVHVHTEYTSSGEPPRSGGSETRHNAAGGPVEMGQRYMVGEFGPEQFVPWTNGQIIPNSKIAPPAQPQQIINVPRPQVIIMQPASTTTNYTTNNNRGGDGGISSDHLFALLGSRG